jgi:hypothetical protein
MPAALTRVNPVSLPRVLRRASCCGATGAIPATSPIRSGRDLCYGSDQGHRHPARPARAPAGHRGSRGWQWPARWSSSRARRSRYGSREPRHRRSLRGHLEPRELCRRNCPAGCATNRHALRVPRKARARAALAGPDADGGCATRPAATCWLIAASRTRLSRSLGRPARFRNGRRLRDTTRSRCREKTRSECCCHSP